MSAAWEGLRACERLIGVGEHGEAPGEARRALPAHARIVLGRRVVGSVRLRNPEEA